MPRHNRKVRATPKGAAAHSVTHANTIVQSLSLIRDPTRFAFRFNDFLRACRAGLAMLPKEQGVRPPVRTGQPKLADFVRTQISNTTDPRFNHLRDIKDVSAHDLVVTPHSATYFAGFTASAYLTDSVEAELRDAEGRTVERRQVETNDDQPVEQPGVKRWKKRKSPTVRYYLKDWPSEDIVSYCREVVKVVDALVQLTYKTYP
jgi:hypothetical protein